ncbi:MAG TPA: DNA-protecting protein DprA [Thiotrichaceae bacterium]|nr:DNA-protecting protein DprA [Thiotrichaceae bacterium]
MEQPLTFITLWIIVKDTDALHYWLKLYSIPGIGPQRFAKLLQAFAKPADIFHANQSQLIQTGLSSKLANSILSAHDAASAKNIEWLEHSASHYIITLDDDEYPAQLKRIDSPPPLLFVQGNITLLTDPQLAIVGSRNPTQAGRDNAYQFAKHLASNGLCITSGMALGIDGFSHKGALDALSPTIAVTATGLDRVYPAAHHDLAHAIAEQGAIVSEHPLGTPVRAQNFPRRNRIISGLSTGTLVVEAAVKSGSLITARYANEQGRDVFAIPGSIHNPLARGCHHLIRQGAKLVETAEHILEELKPVLHEYINEPPTTHPINSTDNTSTSLDNDQRMLLKYMSDKPVSVDQLSSQTTLTVNKVSSILLILELHGFIEPCGSGLYISLRQNPL